ncbi:MAG TPA: type I-C CRISPR-associated protein Cas7/Csd2 [Pirellulales bacterium]|jgi:CRISPR-associated protein Csd2
MPTATASGIVHRYEFVLLFDVINGNPNGDPDAGNAPRIDPETGHGLVSDVCLKRKVRNFISLVQSDANGSPSSGFDIYVKEKAVLNNQHQRAYDALKLDPKAKTEKGKPTNEERARGWMCQTFFDIRMFGAVMSTGVNAGQVRGPVQFAFSRSVDPIVPLEQSITRMAVTTEEESKNQDGGNRTMGRKEIIPYGLYVAHGFISPQLAAQTGFNVDDLQLLARALDGMFEYDRSAARGEMSTRGLWFFKHESPLGNARASQLFELVEIRRRDDAKPPRQFRDYEVTVHRERLPKGVSLLELPTDIDQLV